MRIDKLIGNEQKQLEGVWITYEDDLKFKIAYAQSKVVTREREKRHAKMRKKHGWNRDLPPEAVEKIAIDLTVQFILKDWSGLEDKHGNKIEFNEENARDLLARSAKLRDFIGNESFELSNFEDEETTPEESKALEGAGDAAQAATKSGAAVAT